MRALLMKLRNMLNKREKTGSYLSIYLKTRHEGLTDEVEEHAKQERETRYLSIYQIYLS